MSNSRRPFAIHALFATCVTAACSTILRAGPVLDIVDSEAGTFIDIAAPENLLALGDDDEIVMNTGISNAVFASGPIVIGNNGGVGFQPPSTQLSPMNEALPSIDAFGSGQAVLGFWDDIGNQIDHIYYKEIPNERFIVQWQNAPFNNDPTGSGATFQIQIFHDSGAAGQPPIFAQYLFADIEDPRPDMGAEATIGYQEAGGNVFINWLVNGAPDEHLVTNGTVLSLIAVPEPGSLIFLAVGAWFVAKRRMRPIRS